MITCPKCGKENQPHYKFCLGCGAELPRDGAPKPFVPNTPPGGMPNDGAAHAPTQATPQQPAQPPTQSPPPQQASVVPVAPVAVAPSAPPAPVAPVAAASTPCGQCGHVNPNGNMFCAACGFRLSGGAPAAAAPVAAASPAVETVRVVLTALRADGSEAGSFALSSNISHIGRETGGIFAADSYLSPRHAVFTIQGNRVSVRDENSLNGVYVRLQRDVATDLLPGDVFRIGQEIIKFEPLVFPEVPADGVVRLGAPAQGYVGRIALVIGRETNGNAFPVPEGGVHLGRERGDVLFPEDGYVSGLHCRLSHENGRTVLTDLGSSNGTFLRLREERELIDGDVLLMGQQLFRINF